VLEVVLCVSEAVENVLYILEVAKGVRRVLEVLEDWLDMKGSRKDLQRCTVGAGSFVPVLEAIEGATLEAVEGMLDIQEAVDGDYGRGAEGVLHNRQLRRFRTDMGICVHEIAPVKL
jgi:hypothetical protein